MKRQGLTLALTIALFLPIVGVAAGTSAQDDNGDVADLEATAEAQATEIADLEDRVAALETVVAQEPPATDEPTEESAGRSGPGDEEVLYEADATSGFDEWTGPQQWLYRDGTLVNDGTETRSVILAPYQPTVSDYAVEAEIRLVRCNSDDEGSFGLIARAAEEGAYYRAGPYCWEAVGRHEARIEAVDAEGSAADTLAEEDFTVDAEWHTYRLEVEGDAIRLFIDGELLLESGDVRYVDAGQVGLYSSWMPIEVRSFRVLAL